MPETHAQTAATIARFLADLIVEHESLLESTRAHRASLSRADRAGIANAIRDQAQTIERINTIDSQRRETFGHSISVHDLAATLPQSQRSRVLHLAAQLRELIQATQKEQQVVAIASQSLLAHLEGMLQQVAGRLNQAGTYGRLGRVESGTAVISGIDFTR